MTFLPDFICQCGHGASKHVETMFGIECLETNWHDDAKKKCGCTNLRRKEAANDAKS